MSTKVQCIIYKISFFYLRTIPLNEDLSSYEINSWVMTT